MHEAGTLRESLPEDVRDPCEQAWGDGPIVETVLRSGHMGQIEWTVVLDRI